MQKKSNPVRFRTTAELKALADAEKLFQSTGKADRKPEKKIERRRIIVN